MAGFLITRSQVVYLSLGMGVIAQGCIAFSIKHLPALVISLSLVMQAQPIQCVQYAQLSNLDF